MGKFILLGLDGASFEMLDPMLDSGQLPVLERLLRGGAHGILESTIPPSTFPAWPTMYTGRNPGVHGLTSFRLLDQTTLKARTTTLCDVTSPRLWQMLNQEGIRTGIFNVPATYPAESVDGFMVSGFITPPGATEAVCPNRVREAFYSRFPDYDCNGHPVPAHEFADESKRPGMIEALRQTLEIRAKALYWLLDHEPVDFLWVVLETIDRICHCGYAFLAPGSSHYDTTEGRRVRKWTLDLLQLQDNIIGRILEYMTPDPTVLVVSDHGFAWTPRQFDLRGWLIAQGLMVALPGLDRRLRLKEALRRTVRATGGNSLWKSATRLGRLFTGNRVVERLDETWNALDAATWQWNKSKVWLGPVVESGVRVNTSNLYDHGIVSAEEYDDICRTIIDGLRSLQDPGTGEAIFDRVECRENLYSGPYVTRAADVLLLTHRNISCGNRPHTKPSHRSHWLLPVEGLYDQNNHDINGIIAATGSIIPTAPLKQSNILDVLPTVLYAMGLDIPDNLEGRVLEEAFTDHYRSGHPVTRVTPTPTVDKQTREKLYSTQEEAAISKRLEELGYM